jgi:hypothetical protein
MAVRERRFTNTRQFNRGKPGFKTKSCLSPTDRDSNPRYGSILDAKESVFQSSGGIFLRELASRHSRDGVLAVRDVESSPVMPKSRVWGLFASLSARTSIACESLGAKKP